MTAVVLAYTRESSTALVKESRELCDRVRTSIEAAKAAIERARLLCHDSRDRIETQR